jgi:hypothetical protein
MSSSEGDVSDWLEDDMNGEGNIDDSEEDSDHYDESRGAGNSSHNIRRDPEVHGIDSYVKRQIKHVLSLGEWAARTTQPYAPTGAMGDAVSRQVGELAFYAPKACSASWMPKFTKLIHHCHSARLCKITDCQKMQIREGGRQYFEETNTGTSGEGEWDRCVICKTREDKARWCIDLASNPDMTTYDAREFLENTGKWGELFDKAFRQHARIFEADWSPTGELGMPLEFVGSFAIGDTCKGHLITALAAQNIPFETIYASVGLLRETRNTRTEYSDLPTVTDQRVKSWYVQREKIQYALAADNKTHRMPSLDYCKVLWNKIDDAIIASLGPGATSAEQYTRVGYWAARSMHRASRLSPEQPFASEGEDEGEHGDRAQQPARRRRARRQISDDSEEEDARPRQTPRCAIVESADDHEEEGEEEAQQPQQQSHINQDAPLALRRPRRTPTPNAPAPARSSARLREPARAPAREPAGGSSSSAPPPAVPAREPRQPLDDLASAASNLRSIVTGPSPQHRLLRGYATSIAEMFDLARVLTEKDMHVEAGVAGRGAIVLQELAAKYQDERAR